MTDKIISDTGFSTLEMQTLQRIAGFMIPASGYFPAASIQGIFDNFILRLKPALYQVQHDLRRLDQKSVNLHGRAFAELPNKDAGPLTLDFLAAGYLPNLVTPLVTSYYESDLVLIALGLPTRPAFPLGYDIAPTDWSMVEPVRMRGPIYRKVEPTVQPG